MDHPRYMTEWTAAERACWEAKELVEGMGAHPLLTKAVNLLGEAQDAIAQHERAKSEA